MGLLDDKVAVITGAGRGIGRASAEVFVRESAKVLVADISGAEKDVAAQIGPAAVPFHADVTQSDDVAAMIAAAVEAFGRVDILVNVAGTPASRSPEFLSLEEYETQTDVNLRGVLLCMKHAIPAMVKTGGGAIVNVSTVGSLGVQERAPAMYMSAKSAVNSLTRSVAVEYGPSGIRANAIAPGFTLTEVNRGIPADILHALSLKAPLGRGSEAREQAEVVAFLASDRASFLTGVIIPVDGGWSARLA